MHLQMNKGQNSDQYVYMARFIRPPEQDLLILKLFVHECKRTRKTGAIGAKGSSELIKKLLIEEGQRQGSKPSGISEQMIDFTKRRAARRSSRGS